jgi:long-chain acyl-CoA synthetase
MYSAMLHAPDAGSYDTSSLRACMSGGSAMPVEVLHAFEKQFNAMILEGYGLSETSPVVSFNHPDRERKPGSIGTPIEGVEVRIIDESGQDVPAGEVGELAVRGHCVMQGYWRNPPPRRSRTAGSAPVTWAGPTRTATCTSSTARNS